VPHAIGREFGGDHLPVIIALQTDQDPPVPKELRGGFIGLLDGLPGLSSHSAQIALIGDNIGERWARGVGRLRVRRWGRGCRLATRRRRLHQRRQGVDQIEHRLHQHGLVESRIVSQCPPNELLALACLINRDLIGMDELFLPNLKGDIEAAGSVPGAPDEYLGPVIERDRQWGVECD
jgi:hypothetical protein